MIISRVLLRTLAVKQNIRRFIFLERCYCSVSHLNIVNYEISAKISQDSLRRYIISLKNEYETLSKSQPSNMQRLIEIQPVINILKERSIIVDNIDNLRELLKEKDDELRILAEEEAKELQKKIQEVDKNLLEALLPVDENDNCSSIVLEINAGVGGQEAMLFAKELFEMYSSFAEYKGWDFEIADYEATDIGGVRHASALIDGPSTYQFFRYEAGVHRVQRIPSTEKGGRIHTSTASVIALPQPSDIQVNIDPKDLRIDTKRASGAGGQHVNTTDSAVRIVHIPTGISVECQVDRSQIKNRKLAMAKLRALLYEKQLQSQIQEAEKTRKNQVRSNFRNEKIRTYNFCQDRISDHRLQGCHLHNIKVFLEGGEPLENLIRKLHGEVKMQWLVNAVNSTV